MGRQGRFARAPRILSAALKLALKTSQFLVTMKWSRNLKTLKFARVLISTRGGANYYLSRQNWIG
jgi:hypothetical protein